MDALRRSLPTSHSALITALVAAFAAVAALLTKTWKLESQLRQHRIAARRASAAAGGAAPSPAARARWLGSWLIPAFVGRLGSAPVVAVAASFRLRELGLKLRDAVTQSVDVGLGTRERLARRQRRAAGAQCAAQSGASWPKRLKAR